MRYRTRLVLLVTGLLASAVIIISALLAWNTRNALLASAEDSGKMVANLLARSAGLANEIPSEVEEMLGAQMVAEARIVAHFVDAAEKAGFTPDEINRRLRQIADTTVLMSFGSPMRRGTPISATSTSISPLAPHRSSSRRHTCSGRCSPARRMRSSRRPASGR